MTPPRSRTYTFKKAGSVVVETGCWGRYDQAQIGIWSRFETRREIGSYFTFPTPLEISQAVRR